MAIKVLGTTVIDDSRNLNNIAAIDSTTKTSIITAGLVESNTSVRFTSLGVGTPASGTTGEIRATNDITAYYSDDRLKTRLGDINNATEKVLSLDTFYYEPNEVAQDLGYIVTRQVGISAQQVQEVLPEVVKPAPIDDQYLTVQYEKLVPLLIAAIKELNEKIDKLSSTKDIL